MPLVPNAPSVSDVVHNATNGTYAIWAISGLCLAGSYGVFCYHRYQLRTVPSGRIKTSVMRILKLCPIYAITTFVGIFVPRLSALLRLGRSVTEALALYGLYHLIIAYHGGEKQAVENILSVQPNDMPYLAVPPCCCGCKTCLPKFKMNMQLIKWSRHAVFQYLIVVPVTSLASLAVQIEAGGNTSSSATAGGVSGYDGYDWFNLAMRLISISSVLVAVWGLFIIYVASKVFLTDVHLGFKFFVLKALIVLGVIQSLIIGVIVSTKFKDSDEVFTSDYSVDAWEDFFLLMETFPFTLLMYKAYTPQEIHARAIL